MANTLTVTVLKNTTTTVTLHVYYAYVDTATEANLVIYNHSTYGKNANHIISMKGCMVGLNTLISYDATSDFNAIVLPDGRPFQFSFDDRDGSYIPNTATGTNGDILMSITNAGSGDNGWFIMKVRKGTS